MPRFLIYHPESESLFESDEWWTDGLCSDVTGIEEFEERFRRESSLQSSGNTEAQSAPVGSRRQEVRNMNEAGFSLSFRIVNDKGSEQTLTFRGEQARDWKAVQSSARECVAEMMSHGWRLPESRTAPMVSSAPNGQPVAPVAASSASNGSTGDHTFHATKLKIEFNPKGEKVGKMMGGKFEKFGVIAWPEVLTALGFNLAEMQAGEYKVDMVVAYAVNAEGKPQKITGRAA